MRGGRRGITLLEVILVISILGVLGAMSVPGYVSARRQRQELEAAGGLKSLATAQADFRANDRDRNGIQDFWTGDVAGLYGFGLIAQRVARADEAPLDGSRGVPLGGYFFRALDRTDSMNPPENYRQVTDPASGPVHHETKFGFACYPVSPWGRRGMSFYILNENNSMWRRPFASSTLRPPFAWPSDLQLRSFWSRAG